MLTTIAIAIIMNGIPTLNERMHAFRTNLKQTIEFPSYHSYATMIE